MVWKRCSSARKQPRSPVLTDRIGLGEKRKKEKKRKKKELTLLTPMGNRRGMLDIIMHRRQMVTMVVNRTSIQLRNFWRVNVVLFWCMHWASHSGRRLLAQPAGSPWASKSALHALDLSCRWPLGLVDAGITRRYESRRRPQKHKQYVLGMSTPRTLAFI